MIPLLETYKKRWLVESDISIKPGLTAIKEALAAVNNPQNQLQVVHFAGTNGKGSTLTFVEFMAREHGLNVGKFMSPCIVDVHDQIQVNGQPISQAEMDAVFEQLAQAGLSGKLTDFELVTAAAFIYFNKQQVDLVLLETGMGGREDSTNVVMPIVSVIPSIALEHTNFLGTTIASIAGHKAGIIKKNRPVVIGQLPDEALTVVQQQALKLNAPLYRLDQHFTVKSEGTTETYINKLQAITISNLRRQLLGTHQGNNMALAITAFLEVAKALAITTSFKKIQNAVQQAHLAGRFEQVLPNVYFDGAHNPASIRMLVDTIQTHFATQRIEFVLGILADKDVEVILSLLEEVGDAFYFVDITNERAMPAVKIYELSQSREKSIIQDVHSFLHEPLADQTVRIVTGSLYLLSEIRQGL